MSKRFIAFSLLCLSTTQAMAAPFILGYWGNWHVWDSDKNGRPVDDFQIPGSLNRDTRAPVVNLNFKQQMQKVSAVAYAFLEIYPDAGMHSNVPQKPIKTEELGKIYWSDPWTDLLNSDANTQFCRNNYTTCFFAYDIEKDPTVPRPPVDPTQPGNYFYMGNFDAFTKLQGVQRIISIGGWFHEGGFENGAFKNPTNFINSLIAIIKLARSQGGDIDGVDLDYEPAAGYTPENGAKLADLTIQLRKALDANDMKQVIITAAIFANADKLANFGAENLKAFASALNYVGVMGYDFHGNWDNPAITGLQSNLYQDANNPNQNDFSVVKALKTLENIGISKSKLVIGIPSYGRAVGEVANENHGLYQTFNPGSYVQTDLDNGQVSYYRIKKNWLLNGFKEYNNLAYDRANGAYAYHSENQQFVSYDNPEVIASKAAYVLKEQLGGMMMWELISDLPAAESDSLLSAIHNKLMTTN